MSEVRADEFPFPDIYNFPPFFTLQPVDATREKQLQQWKDLIIGWHMVFKAPVLIANEWPVFENKTIGRRLTKEAIQTVLDYVVKCGNGEWEDAAKTRCKIFFRTPQEIAAQLYAWVTRSGLLGSIYTLYEIHSGEMGRDTDFAGMDPVVLLKALEVLQLQRKAELIPGDTIDETGIKFLSA